MNITAPDIVTLDGVRYRRLDLVGTAVSCWWMYDCQAFHKLSGDTVADVVREWREICEREATDKYGGPDMLCPVIVMDGDRELRRVGKSVHGLKDKANLALWIAACESDADIPRLLAAQYGPPMGEKP